MNNVTKGHKMNYNSERGTRSGDYIVVVDDGVHCRGGCLAADAEII